MATVCYVGGFRELSTQRRFQILSQGGPTDMSLLNAPFDPAREAALVTGAGNGIGRAIAQALTGEGVRTIFADVNKDTVAAAVKASPRPELAAPWVGDLADPAACDALLADAQSAVGRVTHFVHSASPQRREADHAFAVSGETWEQMRKVNLDAGFHLARELARKLIAAHEPGSFLMLTSLHAGTPRNLLHYSTAKAALAMLVKELAKTLGRFGIRVNALVPGAIAAGGFAADPALARHIPLGRLGRSEDLAPMALAVLSNRVSAYVTGAAIVVDGGLSLTNWFDPPELDDL
jgi:NAD(P)-dependent dehydrogenase (short-subunit alcohol dehydrogenase family)